MCGPESWIESPPDWCANCFRKFSKHLSPLSFPSALAAVALSPPPLGSVSLAFPSIGKVKNRTIGIRLSISVFAGLCNRKRQAAGWALCQQNTAGRGAGGGSKCAAGWGVGRGSSLAWGWLQCDGKRCDEVSTDKVRGLMDGQSRELDVRMDEGRGGI